jgi:hypothetical protein
MNIILSQFNLNLIIIIYLSRIPLNIKLHLKVISYCGSPIKGSYDGLGMQHEWDAANEHTILMATKKTCSGYWIKYSNQCCVRRNAEPEHVDMLCWYPHLQFIQYQSVSIYRYQIIFVISFQSFSTAHDESPFVFVGYVRRYAETM